MLRDDNSFPSLRTEGLRDVDYEDGDGDGSHHGENWREHRNDELDDVFGSGPGSPGNGGEGEGVEGGYGNGNTEFFDVPRLREKHEKEGYRDGVTKGKGESVQVGFDEGFSLGAMVGLRAGMILGVLDGLREGVGIGVGLREGEGERERERMKELYRKAVEELSTKGVFGREYWGEDGIWRFEVPGEEGKDVTFEHVARAHPLITKWEAVVEAEVKKWGLDLGIMDGDHDVVDDEIEAAPIGIGKGAVAIKKAAEEPAAPPGKIMGIPKSELNW